MPSTTSLDQDMRNLRMSRYTPTAANEARTWIEGVLGRQLASEDLLDALKDGVALCELVNLVLPSPGIKFKSSNMPFVQMENISHFLRACEMPPINMPAHDRFLTVDLYESKDPAQVMQCLATFSRQANAINPTRFRTCIGPRKAIISPTATGRNDTSPTRTNRFSVASMSPTLTGDSTGSQRSPPPVSSWSNKSDVGSTAPAWSIHQYGWTGGADQGKQGISFGARRQITSQAPVVPSLAEKERIRKEKEVEAERRRTEEEDAQRRSEEERLAKEAEEKRLAEAEEASRWEEETKRHREEERARLAQQKQEWEEQERQWREAERKREEEQISAPKKPPKPRTPSGSILRGQTLSEYQRGIVEEANQRQVEVEQRQTEVPRNQPSETPEQARVRELERQLAEAREREKQYQAERSQSSLPVQGGNLQAQQQTQHAVSHTTTLSDGEQTDEANWIADDRNDVRKQTAIQSGRGSSDAYSHPIGHTLYDSVPHSDGRTLYENVQPPSDDVEAPPVPVRTSIPEPALTKPSSLPVGRPSTSKASQHAVNPSTTSTTRHPTIRSPFTRPANRTDNYLSMNPAPIASAPRISSSTEAGDTAQEQAKLRDDRIASQQKTRAGAWASKSLLEREMERERERQREWETNQATIKNVPRDVNQGVGEGQTWDVNTYGWVKGDSQNRGSSSGSGINVGGRRQIIGPRPQP